MTWVAWKMLTGDRGKYLAIVFGVTFACFLIADHRIVALEDERVAPAPPPQAITTVSPVPKGPSCHAISSCPSPLP
jgi:hypothetical protein